MRIKKDITSLDSAVRVPYSVEVRSPEENRQFGTAPSEGVTCEETPLGKALSELEDKVGVGEYKTFCDHRLIPAVLEVAQAKLDAEHVRDKRNELAAMHNEPVLNRIQQLEGHIESESLAAMEAIKRWEADTNDASLRAAEACASAGIAFKPQEPLNDALMHIRLRSTEAHAAEQKLPFDEAPDKWFLRKQVEWILSVLTGVVVGLSAFAVAGLIHLKRLGTAIPMELLAASFGVAVTLVGGAAVKLCWQEASEAYYLGKPWICRMLVALVVTLSLVSVETVVDQQGLMAAERLTSALASVSGKTSEVHGPSTLTMLILGCVASLPYFAYAAIKGWRQCRRAATNRVLLAWENERLKLIQDQENDPSWREFLGATNQLSALRHSFGQIEDSYAKRTDLLRNYVSELKEALVDNCQGFTQDEIAVIQRAIIHAEGQQQEADRRLAALRRQAVYDPILTPDHKSSGLGILERLGRFFRRPRVTREAS